MSEQQKETPVTDSAAVIGIALIVVAILVLQFIFGVWALPGHVERIDKALQKIEEKMEQTNRSLDEVDAHIRQLQKSNSQNMP